MNTGEGNIQAVLAKKASGEKITMLTAYDYPTALLLDQAGIDIVLVGDSLANVVLGLESTKEVGMVEMLHHAGAVARAVKNAMVVGDMPYCAYQPHPQAAVDNARQFIGAGCCAIKLEWFDGCAQTAKQIIDAGIPVMGHVGLTPQTAAQMKVQGKDAAAAKVILEEAKKLEAIGCFSIVLECIPMELAHLITLQLKIPTIGIGAGPYCDGQVLVSYDVLGLAARYSPKFSKKYVDLQPLMLEAFKQYKNEVTLGHFPDDGHSFHMPQDELKKL
ncbi:MAG: 3-methyl-2-oxobutanoate hydroxymethyltransferase [Candidatus Omnitrophica bacterium]|nr:3-methyl-2-oxobutanoate hydroxymethyltransferase [Candidatus Omnitrophota bacterium]